MGAIRPVVLMVLLFSFSCFFAPSGMASIDSFRQEKFHSPSGKYIVVFTELEHRKYPGKEAKENDILYRVDFIPKGTVHSVASTNIVDPYGSRKSSGPAQLKALFRSFNWSPGERLLILPANERPNPSSPPDYKVLSLDSSLPWKEAAVALDNISWADEYSLAGDFHRTCDYGVALFDGKTGKLTAIKPSESPLGYELISAGKSALNIRMVLDACRMHDSPPKCFTIDLKTGTQKPAACPEAGKNMPSHK